MKHLTPANIAELVISPQGLTLIYAEDQIDPSTAVQHQLQIKPDALDAKQAERVQEFMATVHQWGQDLFVQQAGSDAAPYDNPEEVERWGEG